MRQPVWTKAAMLAAAFMVTGPLAAQTPPDDEQSLQPSEEDAVVPQDEPPPPPPVPPSVSVPAAPVPSPIAPVQCELPGGYIGNKPMGVCSDACLRGCNAARYDLNTANEQWITCGRCLADHKEAPRCPECAATCDGSTNKLADCGHCVSDHCLVDDPRRNSPDINAFLINNGKCYRYTGANADLSSPQCNLPANWVGRKQLGECSDACIKGCLAARYDRNTAQTQWASCGNCVLDHSVKPCGLCEATCRKADNNARDNKGAGGRWDCGQCISDHCMIDDPSKPNAFLPNEGKCYTYDPAGK